MRRSRLWPLAALPLVLAACGGGGEEARDEAMVVETADTSQVDWNREVPAATGADTGMAAGGAMGDTMP